MAGLNPISLIDEPTAAAIAFGIDMNRNNMTTLVVDLGGGTFDVSIVKLEEKVENNHKRRKFFTINKDGNTHLGGEDFDRVILEIACQKYLKEKGINLMSDDPNERQLYAKFLIKLKQKCAK